MKPYHEAVQALLQEYHWNPWFLDTYWPENAPRVKSIAEIALQHAPAGDGRRTLLDVGCASGYMTYLFQKLGYQTQAVDAEPDTTRDEIFARLGIRYTKANLNDTPPLADFPDSVMDIVIMGEVFEHILNHPAGLLQAVYRILRPGGTLILTTPNPSTLANSIRLLGDGYVLWGTPEFLRQVKVHGGTIIERGDIHYREYPAWIVRDLLKEIGYRIEGVQYYCAGIARTHGLAKKVAKTLLAALGLSKTRPFALGYIIAAKKPA